MTLDQVLMKLRELSVIIIKENLAYSLLSDFKISLRCLLLKILHSGGECSGSAFYKSGTSPYNLFCVKVGLGLLPMENANYPFF